MSENKVNPKRMTIIYLLVIVALYFASYTVFRSTHTEFSETDKRNYVIFPQDKLYLYYLYRPLGYADEKLTGVGFHIGQHQ